MNINVNSFDEVIDDFEIICDNVANDVNIAFNVNIDSNDENIVFDVKSEIIDANTVFDIRFANIQKQIDK